LGIESESFLARVDGLLRFEQTDHDLQPDSIPTGTYAHPTNVSPCVAFTTLIL
jgi:hypothetical protein